MTEKKEIEVTIVIPDDLFKNARYHGSRKALLGSKLKDAIPFETTISNTNRHIFVLRHGERLDYIFPDFASTCFDSNGNYTRMDLNMPKTLPKRDNPAENWEKDTPLTNLGVYQAEQVGQGVKNSGVTFDTVICSPFYRCVQTCDAFLRGMGLKETVKICIDAALFEWIGWKVLHGWDSLGDLFTPEDYAKMGFNIDINYEPIMTSLELKQITEEDFMDTFTRNLSVVEKSLKNVNTKNLLIVAHGSNLISCARSFVKPLPKERNEILKLLGNIPYCSFVGIEEIPDERKWRYMTPLATFTHVGNHRAESGMPEKMKEHTRKNAKLIFGNK